MPVFPHTAQTAILDISVKSCGLITVDCAFMPISLRRASGGMATLSVVRLWPPCEPVQPDEWARMAEMSAATAPVSSLWRG